MSSIPAASSTHSIFRGETDGCAVILGPMPLSRRVASLPEVYREPAKDPVDARIKLSAWWVSRGWAA